MTQFYSGDSAITEGEGWLLYALTRLIRPWVAVELGRYRASSTIWMAQGIKDNGRGMLHSIDCLPTEIAADHIRAADVEELVICHDGHTAADVGLELSRRIGPVDLLFIDADHRYEAVKADTGVWLPRLSDAGVAVFHDVTAPTKMEGVGRVIVELLGTGDWRAISIPRLLADEDVHYHHTRSLAVLQRATSLRALVGA